MTPARVWANSAKLETSCRWIDSTLEFAALLRYDALNLEVGHSQCRIKVESGQGLHLRHELGCQGDLARG